MFILNSKKPDATINGPIRHQRKHCKPALSHRYTFGSSWQGDVNRTALNHINEIMRQSKPPTPPPSSPIPSLLSPMVSLPSSPVLSSVYCTPTKSSVSSSVASSPSTDCSSPDFHYVYNAHRLYKSADDQTRPSIMSRKNYIDDHIESTTERAQMIIDIMSIICQIPCMLQTFVATIQYADVYVATCRERSIPMITTSYYLIGLICLLIARRRLEVNCLCRAQGIGDWIAILGACSWDSIGACTCVCDQIIHIIVQRYGESRHLRTSHVTVEAIQHIHQHVTSVLDPFICCPTVCTFIDQLLLFAQISERINEGVIVRQMIDIWIVVSIIDPMCSIYLLPSEWAVVILQKVFSLWNAYRPYISVLRKFDSYSTDNVEYQQRLLESIQLVKEIENVKWKQMLQRFERRSRKIDNCMKLDKIMLASMLKL